MKQTSEQEEEDDDVIFVEVSAKRPHSPSTPSASNLKPLTKSAPAGLKSSKSLSARTSGISTPSRTLKQTKLFPSPLKLQPINQSTAPTLQTSLTDFFQSKIIPANKASVYSPPKPVPLVQNFLKKRTLQIDTKKTEIGSVPVKNVEVDETPIDDGDLNGTMDLFPFADFDALPALSTGNIPIPWRNEGKDERKFLLKDDDSSDDEFLANVPKDVFLDAKVLPRPPRLLQAPLFPGFKSTERKSLPAGDFKNSSGR